MILLALLGGCQTTSEYHNNFGEWQPITRSQAPFKIELPTGSSEFEQATNSSTNTRIIHFSWTGQSSFIQGTHAAAGPFIYLKINTSETDEIAKKLDWTGRLNSETGNKFNTVPDISTVRRLDNASVWVADLPQQSDTHAICMTGLFVADRDATAVGQDLRRDSRGVTDEIQLLSCGDNRAEEAFRKQFEAVMLSIRL
ncbi:hypothetical protein [Radicibacter daui]|uniref:hypothetical protein n=1 Tax=Radicibacter daui TaxID=3064829 RepID=UPI004046FBBA